MLNKRNLNLVNGYEDDIYGNDNQEVNDNIGIIYSEVQDNHSFNHISTVKNSTKPICYRMLLDFACENGSKCPFDHDPVKLNGERERCNNNWRKKKKQSNIKGSYVKDDGENVAKKIVPGYIRPREGFNKPKESNLIKSVNIINSVDDGVDNEGNEVNDNVDYDFMGFISGLFTVDASHTTCFKSLI